MPLKPFRCLPLAFLALASAHAALTPKKPVPSAHAVAAQDLYDKGRYEDAVAEWRKARGEARSKKDVDGEMTALLGEADSLQPLGHHKLQLNALNEAGDLADRAKSNKWQAAVKAARGAAKIYSRQAIQSQDLLNEALKTAREVKEDRLIATTLVSLATITASEDKFDEAEKQWDEAIGLAERMGDRKLALRAKMNKATAAFGAKKLEEAKKWVEEAAKEAESLPDGHEKAFVLMGAGQMLHKLFLETDDHDNELRLKAFRLQQAAAKTATALGDNRVLCYALGYQGALYEFEKNYDAALILSRRALALAQQVQSGDALYRWQWQVGRLLAKTKKRDEAIEAYRRAVKTLEGIRNDIAIRFGNRHQRSSFREAVGALYTELADLLLQRAEAMKDIDEIQMLCREARGTAELLKSAELEDYFQDDCVSMIKSKKTKTLEDISQKAAVVYIIPLPDRTEILVSLPPPPRTMPLKPGEEPPQAHIERVRSVVTEGELTETVRTFRVNLENRTTNEFLEQGQQLYTWLIKPLEPLMEKHKFDTMVFVPDGALRTVPMAALHDGERFLIEKYAVAVTPGLELMESKASAKQAPRIMMTAISDSVQDFPPLPNVVHEMDELSRIFGTKPTLMNSNNVKANIEKQFEGEPYTIVHIASHGHIDSDIRKSYVLTYDDKLTLDDLERLIRPSQLADKPLELLTLSACQTAAGDDRAALGLAGMAVKAGARAAFATMWFVNDQASAKLVVDFYTELKTRPDLTKAQALQHAQRELLKDERFQHPCYWAPYIIIGNWL